MRKALVLLPLAILLTNGAGFYIYYCLELSRIHAEMRETIRGLPDSSLELIILSGPQFKDAIVEENEIMVSKKMYDIARTTQKNDSVYVYCLHDENEEDLFALLEVILTKPFSDSHHKVPSPVQAYLDLVYLVADNKFELTPFSDPESCNTCYSFTHKEPGHRLESPPPKISGGTSLC